jgi:hypothetical protein
MMKKTLALLLIILNACSLTALAAAGDVPATEYESGDYTYTVGADGTAVITSYIGSDERVAVPAELDGYPVSALGDWVLPFYEDIIAVSLPAGIQTIGPDAFGGCYSLSSIEVSPDNPYFTAADGVLFRTEDNALIAYPLGKPDGEYIVPQGTRSLADHVFYDCFITSITLPASLQTIGDETFHYCSYLTSILVSPDNPYLTSIDGVLFRTEDNTLLAYPRGKTEGEYSVPQGTRALADKVFSGCSFGSVNLPDSLLSIGAEAFSSCSCLTSITLPENLQSIGDGAFSYCRALTIENLPDSLRSIGDGAFAYCPSISSVKISPDHPVFTFIDDVLFDKVNNVLILYPAEKAGETYDVAQNIRSVSVKAFAGCSSLTSVSLPDGLTSIAEGTFSECSSLASVSLPAGLTSIGDGAFTDCASLASVDLPDGLLSIGDWAFAGCAALASIDIPNGITSIAEGTCYQCYSLASVSLPDGIASIGDWAFSCCSALESIDLPDGLRIIGDGAFSESPLTSAVLPEGVVSIGNEAFKTCSALTSVSLPDSLQSIGDEAFCACTELASVTLPEGLGAIGSNSFASCDSLASIEVSADNPVFSSIDGVLFDKAGQTLMIYPPGKPDESYSVPAGTLSIGFNAFVSPAALTSVSLPDGLLSIARISFYGFDSPTTVSLPASLEFIDDFAFIQTDALTLLVPRNSYAHQYAKRLDIPFKFSD